MGVTTARERNLASSEDSIEHYIHLGVYTAKRFTFVVSPARSMSNMATETQPRQNNSLVLQGAKSIQFEERPVPKLASPHDVLLQVNYTGICGSDVHYWVDGRIGEFVVKDPMVLGHESSGTVLEAGSQCRHLKKGDRVAMEPGIPCRRCVPCKSGKYNLCEDMAFAATPPIDGTLAKYYVLPEDFCYKLPDHVSLEEGALLEPLAVAVHITRQSNLKHNDTVVVFGAGPVGLLCCAVARSLGARQVIAVDIVPSRLEFAKQFAATSTYQSQKISAEDNAANIMRENNLPLGADVAIDASGAEPSIQTAIHVLRRGGSYVQGGMGKDTCTFPIMAACIKEVKISGSFRYSSGDYDTALAMVSDGSIPVKKLITRQVEFEEAIKAFEDIRDGKGIKVLIKGPN